MNYVQNVMAQLIQTVRHVDLILILNIYMRKNVMINAQMAIIQKTLTIIIHVILALKHVQNVKLKEMQIV